MDYNHNCRVYYVENTFFNEMRTRCCPRLRPSFNEAGIVTQVHLSLKKKIEKNYNVCTGTMQFNEIKNYNWNNKVKPVLVTVHNLFKDVDLHQSPILDMFSVDIWTSYIDIHSCIKCDVDEINSPKRNVPCDLLKQSVIKMLEEKYAGFYRLYTDGSKGKGVGAAFFDPQSNNSKLFKLQNDICIMRAELVALHEALSYAIDLERNKIIILTDSKSALQHLARCVSGSRGMPIAYNILKILHRLHSNCVQIVLQWIPSHVGIAGNEQADSLANMAVSGGVEIGCKPYGSELMYLAKAKCNEQWQILFNKVSETKGIWYGTIQNKVYRVPWFDCASLPRELLVLAFRVRSGHIPLNYFLNLMRVAQSPLCLGCNKTEDLLHFLLECDQNKDARGRYLDGIDLFNGSVNVILSHPLSEEAMQIYRFIRQSFASRD